MIVVSDNSATNQIIDTVGIDRANVFFAVNGWKDTHLAGKIFHPKRVSDQMMQIMAAQQLEKFNLSLSVRRIPDTRKPLLSVPEGKVIMCNKGGSLEGKVLHDVAIMLLPNG